MAKIYSLSISNFRGINKFKQTFQFNDFVCIIGRGDSGKTSILDAIDLVLSSNWKVTFFDNDFHNSNIEKPIEIIATLYDLPESILVENKFGLYLRGIDKSINRINDQIDQNDIPALTIKLIVDKNLEPIWYVTNDREQEDLEIKSRDRKKLNTFYISDYIDRHFSWSQGSPLHSILKAEDSQINASGLLLKTIREAKEKIDNNNFTELDGLVTKLQIQASKFGLDLSDINTTIDFRDIAFKEGKINLHEDSVPLRLKGKGSKRLLSIAIQLELFQLNNGGILLIDEIEQGLEPDRVQNLVRVLKNDTINQVFVTTHSRDVIVELNATDIFKLSKNSNLLYNFELSAQGQLRGNPEAFFANKIILCEGATEVGIVRGINKYHYENNNFIFSTKGVRYADCGGDSKIMKYLMAFLKKEYDLLIFCDSDNDNNSSVKKLKEAASKHSIPLIECESGNSIENQIFNDLNYPSVKRILELDLLESAEALNESIKSKYKREYNDDWDDDILENDSKKIRNILGKVSNKNSWFKRVDLSESVGQICMNSIDQYDNSHLNKMFTDLNNWVIE